MHILIGADLVPTESNFEYFKNGDAVSMVGNELEDILDKADCRIFNLEVPLADVSAPIEKCGANLIAPTYTVNGYKALGVDILTLANNHILDQGAQGLRSTIRLLEGNGIKYLGAGENLTEASKPYIVENEGKKIGIYACAEHEFSISTSEKPGANPFDPLESLEHIERLKTKCDYVIVLYHGGKERYRYTSPNLQKICRKICDKGADLVVCQHSHCVGCEEKYASSTIVYGQGDFLFDHGNNEFYRTSLLIDLDTESGKIDYIPLRKDGAKVRCANDSDDILNEFYRRSEQIKDEKFITDKYKEFAASMKKNYLMTVCGAGIVFRIINKLCGHRLKFRISKKRELAIKNYLMCEAHNELFSASLDNE